VEFHKRKEYDVIIIMPVFHTQVNLRLTCDMGHIWQQPDWIRTLSLCVLSCGVNGLEDN